MEECIGLRRDYSGSGPSGPTCGLVHDVVERNPDSSGSIDCCEVAVEVNSRVLYDCLIRDLSGPIDSCLEAPSVAANSLKASLLKKFEDDSTGEADAAALRKFISVNERCGRYKMRQMQEWEWMMVGEVRDHLYHFFYPTSDGHILDWAEIFQNSRSGPGASIGARGEDFYTKHFDSTLTYTHKSRSLVVQYQNHIANTSYWKSAEILRQSRYGFRQVSGSTMSTVPKNSSISRTICTEPSLNMFYQLGVGEVMSNRLRSWGLDIDTQSVKNRTMAREGSLQGTFGTIDLASASDSMSLSLMRYLLPPEIFLHLWMLRCDQACVPGFGDVELNMISTMGNGYTFPLQTCLFACVVLAVYKCLDLPAEKSVDNESRDTWGVFGDDIIVRREAYDWVCRILELFGFEVNREKSFNEGPFRESCGTDWYAGVDIRGVYCKTLRTVGARFSLINRLNRWSAKHGILLPNTVGCLLQTVPVVKVPLLEGDDAGVKVPLSESGYHGDGAKMFAYVKYAKYGPKLKYDAQTETLVGPPKSRKRRPNLTGLVVCMLQGSFGGGTVSLRARAQDEKYHRCRAKVHFWDSLVRVLWVDHPPLREGHLKLVPELSPDEWQHWSSVVSMHFASVRRRGN